MAQKTIYLTFGGKRHAVTVEVEHENEDGTRITGTVVAVTPVPEEEERS